MRKVLVIDNYDSFVYNLVQLLREAPEAPRFEVVRNDAVDFDRLEEFGGILLSPGPGVPAEAGDLLRVAARRTPRNGYCLFLKVNMQAFDTKTLYDPGNLVMSLGCLPRLNASSVSVLADNRVMVEWKHWSDKDVAHADDRLCVVVLFEGRLYSPKVLEGITACRSDRSVTIDLGEGWRRRAHLYCFFASPDGQAYSPSDYLCVTPKTEVGMI